MSIDIIDALDGINVDYEYVSRGNTYADIEWLDTRTQPTEAELNAKVTELENAKPLKDLRAERNILLAQQIGWRCKTAQCLRLKKIIVKHCVTLLTHTQT